MLKLYKPETIIPGLRYKLILIKVKTLNGGSHTESVFFHVQALLQY